MATAAAARAAAAFQEQQQKEEFSKNEEGHVGEDIFDDCSTIGTIPLCHPQDAWRGIHQEAQPVQHAAFASREGMARSNAATWPSSATSPRESSGTDHAITKPKASSNKSPESTKRRGKKWEGYFADWLDFRNEFGHCSVPFHDDPSNAYRDLANWIKRQRYHYKLKMEGHGRCSISDDRIAQLESVPGFVWNSHCAAWDAKFEELADFQRRHGHCNVPRNYPKNPQLRT